jgi:hypothetical protein
MADTEGPRVLAPDLRCGHQWLGQDHLWPAGWRSAWGSPTWSWMPSTGARTGRRCGFRSSGARTAQALAGDAWTTDGNYSKVRDIVWGLADTVVWLDYSLPIVLSRVIGRTLRRTICQEELWSGNREHLGEVCSAATRSSAGRCGPMGAGGGSIHSSLAAGVCPPAIRAPRLAARCTRAWLEAVVRRPIERYWDSRRPTLGEQRDVVHGQDANPCCARPG